MNQQEFAFSLFRDTPDQYKKTVIALVHDFIATNETVTESRLRFELRNAHNVPKEDIEAAVTALKSPLGFDALHVWRTRQTKKTLLRIKPSPTYDGWVDGSL
jgi:hypothetical protein